MMPPVGGIGRMGVTEGLRTGGVLGVSVVVLAILGLALSMR